MTDPRTILERELADVDPRPFALDTFHLRRHRRRRNQRIRAGLVAATIGVAAVALAIRALDVNEGSVPAGPFTNGEIVVLQTDGLYAVSPDGARTPFLLSSDLADECPAATACGFLGSSTGSTYAWSPDGQQLAFIFGSSPQGEGHYDALYVVGSDGTNIRKVTGCGPPENLGACTDLAWSPDGTQIAVVSSDAGLWAVDVDSGATRTIADHRAVDPAWSPDGTVIAYRVANPTSDDIRIVSADGTSDAALVDELPQGQGAGSPSWSPDGTRILFASQASSSSEPMAIWVSTNGNLSEIVGNDPDRFLGDASWSPDGRLITWDAYPGRRRFSGPGGPFRAEIWVARPDGTDAHRVYQTRCCAAAMTTDAFAGPAFSPDGTVMTFSVIFDPPRADESGVYVMNLDGSDLHRVATTGTNPAWRPIPADAS